MAISIAIIVLTMFIACSNSSQSRISSLYAPKLKPVRTSGRVENQLIHNQNEEFQYQKSRKIM